MSAYAARPLRGVCAGVARADSALRRGAPSCGSLALALVGFCGGDRGSRSSSRSRSGSRRFAVLSGSMEPTIATGDVVVVDKIAPLEARVGDVVTFRSPENPAQDHHAPRHADARDRRRRRASSPRATRTPASSGGGSRRAGRSARSSTASRSSATSRTASAAASAASASSSSPPSCSRLSSSGGSGVRPQSSEAMRLVPSRLRGSRSSRSS